MKKLLTGILALGLATSMGITAFAANTETNNGTAGTNITVNGTYQAGAPASDVISVDIGWEEMSFTYTAPSKGTWNAATHKYENATEGGWAWNDATETKTAPVITVTNHSNTEVKASFTFALETGISGLTGTFSKNSFVLETAVGTERDNAPKGETAFSVDGTAIDADKTLGTITVTVEKAYTLVSSEDELNNAINAK